MSTEDSTIGTICETTASSGNRFTDRQRALARRLLATYGLDPDNSHLTDKQRFELFDQLVFNAMAYTVESQRLGKPMSESGMVAQCAVEMIAQDGPFDPETIAGIDINDPA